MLKHRTPKSVRRERRLRQDHARQGYRAILLSKLKRAGRATKSQLAELRILRISMAQRVESTNGRNKQRKAFFRPITSPN